jgi:hypothetical protein
MPAATAPKVRRRASGGGEPSADRARPDLREPAAAPADSERCAAVFEEVASALNTIACQVLAQRSSLIS